MIRLSAVCAAALMATGCASFSPDAGMDDVARGVALEAGPDAGGSVTKITTTGQARRARERAAALLGQGAISADAAVQVALLNNRDLQAGYNELGLSEAEYVQAGLPPNPGLSLMRVAGTGVVNVEARLIEDLLGLFTLKRRTEIAAEHFEHAKHQAIATTLRLASDTRRAYIRAIAAEQQATFLDAARAAVDASVRLDIRLAQAGGGDQLDQAELAAFYAELSARVGQARLVARRERESLVRLMGLWGGDVGSLTLPVELPALPRELTPVDAVETQAIERRADLVQARHDVMALTKSLALTDATRWVSMVQLAGIVNTESANPLTNSNTDITRGGAELDVTLPVFDTGEARQRSARESYMRALNRLAARAVDARSQARIAYETYRGTYDIARYWQDRVLPLRQTVSREIAARYNNGVLAGEGLRVDLFKFLADARTRTMAEASALDARRDFFLADVDLQAALTIGPGTGIGSDQPATMP
jgi:outer membrane protein TolC